MKKLLLAVWLLLPAITFSQANQSGTFYWGLGTGLTFGSATLKSSFINLKEVKGSGVSLKFSYGIKAQYGISDVFSVGIIVRRESAIYATSYNYDSNDTIFTPVSTDVSSSGFFIAVDDKYFLVNHDDFSLTVGPLVGFYTGNATLKTFLVKGNLSGFNYGVTGGFNWYWGEHYGMSLDIAYNYHSLSGEPNNLSDFIDIPSDEVIRKYKVTGGGIFFCLGFIAKFGGE